MTYRLIDAPTKLSGVLGGPEDPNAPKWDAYYAEGGQPTIVDDGRGGYCIRIGGYSTNWFQQGMYKTYPATDEVMCSAYMRFSALSNPQALWNWYVGGVDSFAHDRLYVSSSLYGDTKLRLTAHNTATVRATGSYSWVVNTWVHVEVYLKIHPTAGRFIVKLKPAGGSYTTDIDFTGDTSTGTTKALNWMGDRGDLVGTHDLADIVIRTGESNFLGVTRVRTLRPSAAGSSTALTPTPSVANFITVLDVPDDGDSTYVSGGSSAKDLYTFTDLKPLDVPVAAQLNMWSRKDDGSLRQIKPVAKTASEVQGATQTITNTASYADYVERYVNDPADATAWTKAKIDAAEFGAVIVA